MVSFKRQQKASEFCGHCECSKCSMFKVSTLIASTQISVTLETRLQRRRSVPPLCVAISNRESAYSEEILGGSGVERAVEDLRLLGEIVGRFDRRQHALDGEERGEVGGVRRDDDECEEPPRTAHYPPRHRSFSNIPSKTSSLSSTRSY